MLLVSTTGLFHGVAVIANVHWCNGEFREGDLAVHPADRGLTNGLGLFETILAVDGRPIALDLHARRLGDGAARLRWEIAFPEISAAMMELLERTGFTNGKARVRVGVTAGSGDLRATERGERALCWITVAPCPDPPASMKLVSVPFPRNERSFLAGLKCASYAESLLALDHSLRAGADEALFLNTRGELCETATANIFLVKSGQVFTPPLGAGCLPGTMRERVLCRIPAVEAMLLPVDLEQADEVFLTSATRGVVPVVAVDGREFPIGPATARLRDEASTGWD